MRRFLRSWLNRAGYDLHRLELAGRPIDVLGLLVRDRLREPKPCFVLQVGANDGRSGDPLFELIVEHDLPALLVEPLPDAFALLRANYGERANLSFENCAISEVDGSRTMWRLRAAEEVPEWARQWASFDREVFLRNCRRVPNYRRYVETLQVPSMSFPSLLAKHGVEEVGLLQIDTEGFDHEILRLALAAGLRPDIIGYEHAHLSTPARNRCIELLSAHGYGVCKLLGDTIALRSR